MNRREQFAPAKINLFLHVLGRRADGYHDLESLVVFADIGDRIAAEPAEQSGLAVEGPFAEALADLPQKDNLVTRAARVAQAWGLKQGAVLPPLKFTIEKNLPPASGIGGGSADAAATLRLCAEALSLEVDGDLYARATELGADVPVCLAGKPSWMAGIGEELVPVEVPGGLWLLLVNPRVEVPTGKVFGMLPANSNAREVTRPEAFADAATLITFLKDTANSLEAPALAIAPIIGEVLEALRDTSTPLARMSGSGATCFGLYENETTARDAATSIRDAHPDWWVRAAAVRG